MKDFVELAFFVGIEIDWYGKGIERGGKNRKTGETLVKVDERYFRPSEVDYLEEIFQKQKRTWLEAKFPLKNLLKMVDYEINTLKNST